MNSASVRFLYAGFPFTALTFLMTAAIASSIGEVTVSIMMALFDEDYIQRAYAPA